MSYPTCSEFYSNGHYTASAILPERRTTGIVLVQTVEQQSVDWFEILILLDKLELIVNSKISVVPSFLPAKK